MTKPLKELYKKVEQVIDTQGSDWFEQARSQLSQFSGDLDATANNLVFLTSVAKKKLGMTLLNGEIKLEFPPDKYGQRNKIYLEHWTITDAARIILLTEALKSGTFSVNDLFQLCFKYSDGGERASLLKGLSFLSLGEESTSFIISTARTNSLEIFSALVYKNPWVVMKFPIPAYNQVVLKALFLNINIMNLEGLRAARNPELGRMAADYVQERLDAGREIPESIWLAVDADLLTDEALMAWESALKMSEPEGRNQLARQGREWQPDFIVKD